jgi:hypothetical protein
VLAPGRRDRRGELVRIADLEDSRYEASWTLRMSRAQAALARLANSLVGWGSPRQGPARRTRCGGREQLCRLLAGQRPSDEGLKSTVAACRAREKRTFTDFALLPVSAIRLSRSTQPAEAGSWRFEITFLDCGGLRRVLLGWAH